MTDEKKQVDKHPTQDIDKQKTSQAKDGQATQAKDGQATQAKDGQAMQAKDGQATQAKDEQATPLKEAKTKEKSKTGKSKNKKAAKGSQISSKLQEEVVTSKKSRLHGRKKTIFTIAVIFLGVSLLFTAGVFGVLSFIQENSMRITVNRSRIDALALYSEGSFSRATTMMNVRGPIKMDNITYAWLPQNIGEHTGGTHHGENYIAFTFYVRNDGGSDIYYESEIVLKEITKNMDAAIRVMVIENGESAIYAKARANGDPEPVANSFDMMATPFESAQRVMHTEPKPISAGQANKYTVVIWLEGEDADCNDNILGGWVTLEMKFNAVEG